MSTETVSRYLDDVARLLGEVDPAARAEVLAGVHDHLEAALGTRPWGEPQVRQALDQLGPPEEIAAAALEDTRQQMPQPQAPFMARAWEPPVAVTVMAIGLIGVFWLFSRFNVFHPVMDRQFVRLLAPFSFLRGIGWALVLPSTPLIIVAALLVTIPCRRGAHVVRRDELEGLRTHRPGPALLASRPQGPDLMAGSENVREVLEGQEVLDRLATVEHERWAHWQQYVHDQCERQDDGSLAIPPDLVQRWEMQIATPYSDLSPEEQRSDQVQVLRYLPVVIAALG